MEGGEKGRREEREEGGREGKKRREERDWKGQYQLQLHVVTCE